jgi:site-specific DNA-methyltransferase (adenine-specific)
VSVTVHHGDCLDVLRGMGEASVDSVVTDPPAGISFMGREWDHHKGGRDAWVAWMVEVAAECLRVAKPGAHALVWALPRTSHWTATAWENAGWQVRDRVAFLHGCGFPKGKNQLKPAVEDWWLLRKPLACPTVAAQVLATGTGALNVDGCRVGIDDGEREIIDSRSGADRGGRAIYGAGIVRAEGERFKSHAAGRWPANLVHDGSPEVLEAFAAFGAKDSTRANGNPNDTIRPDQSGYFREREDGARLNDANIAPTYRDTGTAARFFYSAKASKAERAGSKHPTVKPVALMRWLCRLVTPPGGVVLDPFAGSGTTGEAARLEGFGAVLIEREAEHVADIRRRLGRAAGADTPLLSETAA